MKTVILETPYAGELDNFSDDREKTFSYARKCLEYSVLNSDEAPFSAQLLYEQDGILDGNNADERSWGIKAGWAWSETMEAHVIAIDLGISDVMKMNIARAKAEGREIIVRSIYNDTDKELEAQAIVDSIEPGKFDAGLSREKIVIISPFSGNTEDNLSYAHKCVMNSLRDGFAPWAPHTLYTQAIGGSIDIENDMSVNAGDVIAKSGDRAKIYVELGITSGMRRDIEQAKQSDMRIMCCAIDRPVTAEDRRKAGIFSNKAAIRQEIRQKPTIQVYGLPSNPASFFEAAKEEDLAVLVRGEGARGNIHSFTSEIANADAIFMRSNADPYHIVTMMAESEVNNKFMQLNRDFARSVAKGEDKPEVPRSLMTKPIVFVGTEEDFEKFFEVISGLREKDVIRKNFLEIITRYDTDEEALTDINKKLPGNRKLNGDRADRDNHIELPNIINESTNPDAPKKPDITICWFGSATTTTEEYIEDAKELAKGHVRNGWGVLHGGGVMGVMGALTEGVVEVGGYVEGITAHCSGALSLSGSEEGIPDGISCYKEAKDMPIRILEYWKNSQGGGSLPGGIGSLEEIAQSLDMRRTHHSSMFYTDVHGDEVMKPFVIENIDGIFNGFIEYYESRGLGWMIEEYAEISEWHGESLAIMEEHFAKHPPMPTPEIERGAVRKIEPKSIRPEDIANDTARDQSKSGRG